MPPIWTAAGFARGSSRIGCRPTRCGSSEASGYIPPMRLAVALVVAVGLIAAPASARAAVPASFFGVMADGPIFAPTVDLGSELALMRASGAGNTRVALEWRTIEPQPGVLDFTSPGAVDRAGGADEPFVGGPAARLPRRRSAPLRRRCGPPVQPARVQRHEDRVAGASGDATSRRCPQAARPLRGLVVVGQGALDVQLRLGGD